MTQSHVRLSRQSDGVAVLRIDRPKVNALSVAVLDQMAELVAGLAGDLPGAMVVWGGERIFAAGADLDEVAGGELASGEDGARVVDAFHRALNALSRLPRAVVAAINGYALGGGCELALACDLRVAGVGARLGLPEVTLGIIPGGGGTQRLARLVGPSRAKDLIFSGRQVGAEEALAMGLVDRVVPDAEVVATAAAWAAELAGGAVVAQGLAKRAVDGGLDGTLDDGLVLERRLFSQALLTEDAREGIAAFLEHGPGRARFSGR